MTGMNTAVNAKSPYITGQFNHALFLQFAIYAGIVILIAIAATLFVSRFRANVANGSSPFASGPVAAEPRARRLLRIGFGAIWVLDGLLQLQPQMVLGLPTDVVSPTVSSAPSWFVGWVTFGTNAWLRHPVTAASATVWLQLGLGLWLIVANRGWLSRSAGIVSGAWALTVWIFGNGMGGLFVAPISWMTGAPGAVLFYGLAGIAIALSIERLRRPRFALWSSRLTAIGLTYFAILQAWPGRGFWNGGTSKSPGTLPAMAQSMGSVTQPAFASSIQHWFFTFTLTWSWLYNALIVITLATVALCFFSNKAKYMKWATTGYVVVAIVNWVLVQDFAIFGGMGTDLNSMIPSVLFVVAVYLLVSETEHAGLEIPVLNQDPEKVYARAVGTTAAVALCLLGAVPMALVGILPGTSSDLAEASTNSVQSLSTTAPDFTLTNQNGQKISLASLRGNTVVLSFLDPVCTNDCPVEAQQMRIASEQLGPNSKTVFVAVNTNPLFRSQATLRTFTSEEGLSSFSSWEYLTGSVGELQSVWNSYAVGVQLESGGGMVAHAEPIYVISPTGQLTSTWTAVVGASSLNTVLSQSGVALIVSQVKKAQ